MEPQIQAWQEEEVEEDTVFLRRNSRQHNSNYSSNVTPNGGNEANGAEETEKTQEKGAEEAEKTQKNEAEQTEETEEAEKTQENVAEEAEQTEENEHSNSVYFETHQGTGSGHGVSGMEDNATESSASEADSSDGDLDLKRNKFEIQRIPSTEIIRECTKSSANEILFGLSPVTAQKLHDQNIKNLKDLQNSAEEDAEDDLLEVTDNELTDLDVERVLQKQTTHDLYCPNCNSCITRRVVLCRKRPRVRKIPRTPKPRNKLETRELNFNLPYEANGQGPKKVDVSLNESPTPASDHNNDGELNVSPNDNLTGPDTEIFRCLSCFSFFIPTGNGSKLFQCLGGSGDNPNTQDVQNRPAPTENWWFKIFVNKKTSIDDGNDVIIGESLPVQTKPLETGPVQTHAAEKQAVEVHTTGMHAVEKDTVQTQVVGKHAVETHTVGMHEVEKDTVQMHATERDTDQMHKVQMQPVQKWFSNIFSPDNEKASIDQVGKQAVEVHTTGMHAVEKDTVQTHTVQTQLVQTQVIGKHAVETHTIGMHGVEKDTVQMHATERDTDQTHKVQMQPVQKWFSNIFSLDNEKASIDQGDVKIDIRPQTVKPQAVVQPHPVESKPLQTQPVETHPVETLPVQTQPLQLQPVHTLPVQTQPVHTQRMNTVEPRNWDILKSIVYGGLVESITSLGVVSSAAGAGATTLNILALGLASMVGGLLIIAHNVRQLKNDHFQMHEQEDRYQRVLGQRQNFSRHVIVVFLSFIIFGLVAPVVYGFSFLKSDDRDLKIAAVAGSSLACIVLLAAAKAHVQNRSYLKTVLYYVSLGITASGISYVVGDLFDKLMEKLGLFTSTTEAVIPFLETDLMNTNMMKAAWSSY